MEPTIKEISRAYLLTFFSFVVLIDQKSVFSIVVWILTTSIWLTSAIWEHIIYKRNKSQNNGTKDQGTGENDQGLTTTDQEQGQSNN